MKKKVLCLFLALLMMLPTLMACVPEDSDPESLKDSQGNLGDEAPDAPTDPYALDPSIPYQLSYTSNGDGTCAVTGIIFNSLYRESFDLIIPETSPDGETVTRIAWGDTIDSILYNRCPRYVIPEDMEKLLQTIEKEEYEKKYQEYIKAGYTEEQAEMRAEASTTLMTGPLANFYKLYDPSSVDPEYKEKYLTDIPLCGYMPILAIDATLSPKIVARISCRLGQYAPNFAVEQNTKIKNLLAQKGVDAQTIDTLMFSNGVSVVKGEYKESGFSNCSVYLNHVSIPKTVTSVSENSFKNLHSSGEIYGDIRDQLLLEAPLTIVKAEPDDITIKEFLTSDLRNIYFEQTALPETVEQKLDHDWKWYANNGPSPFDENYRQLYWYSETAPTEDSEFYGYAWRYVDGIPTPW